MVDDFGVIRSGYCVWWCNCGMCIVVGSVYDVCGRVVCVCMRFSCSKLVI